MYGLIGQIHAISGRRQELAEILVGIASEMPGCVSWVVANDLEDPDALWVTEVWESKKDHQDALKLPAVRDAIARGRPLMETFGERFETEPLTVDCNRL